MKRASGKSTCPVNFGLEAFGDPWSLLVVRDVVYFGKHTFKPKSQTTVPFQVAAAGAHRDVLPTLPGYLDVQLEKLTAMLTRKPKRSEVPVTCDVQMVVEYYAR
jgi:ribosomal protein S4